MTILSLPHSCQSERKEKTGAKSPPPSLVLAPESALGSLSSVALSSAQVTFTIPPLPRPKSTQITRSFRVDFCVRQRYPFGVDFYLRQQGVHSTLFLLPLSRLVASSLAEPDYNAAHLVLAVRVSRRIARNHPGRSGEPCPECSPFPGSSGGPLRPKLALPAFNTMCLLAAIDSH